MYEIFMIAMIVALSISIFSAANGKPDSVHEESTNDILKDIRQYEQINFFKDLNDK